MHGLTSSTNGSHALSLMHVLFFSIIIVLSSQTTRLCSAFSPLLNKKSRPTQCFVRMDMDMDPIILQQKMRTTTSRRKNYRAILLSTYTQTQTQSQTQSPLSSSQLFSNKDDDNEDDMIIIPHAMKNANFLEIRLDATLASCYGLCRFLIYDLTTGAKEVPGWQLSDFILLGGAFSSCIVLSLIWTVVGIYTGIFDVDAQYTTSNDDYDLFSIAFTAAIVGPLWLAIEVLCGWPPSGVILANNFEVEIASTDFFYAIATGSVGLMSVMSLCKYYVYTSGWK